jgi:hypothetical protein
MFDASDFMPRSQCGDWPGWLAAASQAADGLIALAYFVIPLGLFWLWRRKRDVLPRPRMLLGFAWFILGCGLTHVCGVLAFHWPAYRFFVLVSWLTALVSVRVALSLPGAVRHFASLPTPGEYAAQVEALAAEVERRKSLEEDLIFINRAQSEHNLRLRMLLESRAWVSGRSEELAALRAEVAEVLKQSPGGQSP